MKLNCKNCNLERNSSEFSKTSTTRGFNINCKECVKKKNYESVQKYRENNKEKVDESTKKYRENNKEKCLEASKKYNEENKEKVRLSKQKFNKENKDKINKTRRVYRSKNREKINATARDYRSLRVKTDTLFKLKENIRNSINMSFRHKNYNKKFKTESILGCSFDEFKIYLESKFEFWMTWNNKGLYSGELNYGWDIDHIIPVSSAKTEEDIIKLNHYTNLQPLCSYINRVTKKGRV